MKRKDLNGVVNDVFNFHVANAVHPNGIAVLMLRLKMEKGSQKEAAKSIGISEQYFSDIINGRRAVSARVAEYFGYKPLCLFQLIDQVKK